MAQRFGRRSLLSATAASGLVSLGHTARAQGEASVAASAAPRGFRLGLVTYNFAADWELPVLLRRCKAAGYAAIEPRTTHKHGIEPALSREERASVRRQIEDSGVTLWCLGSICEFHSPDASVVQKNIDDCRRWIELAHDLGARTVKVRPNNLPKEVEENKTLEQIGRALSMCGEAAQPAKVEICCEVHGHGTADPRRMRRIMDVANHPSVGVTWNSNGTDVHNGSVKEGFELLRPFIKSCHINELLGGYPYRELFALLRQAGYDRFTEMELNPPLESKSESDNVRFMRYYKAVWDELSKA